MGTDWQQRISFHGRGQERTGVQWLGMAAPARHGVECGGLQWQAEAAEVTLGSDRKGLDCPGSNATASYRAASVGVAMEWIGSKGGDWRGLRRQGAEKPASHGNGAAAKA